MSQQPNQGGNPIPTQAPPPPPQNPRQIRSQIIEENEKKEEQRTLLYTLIFIIVLLVIGLIAGFIDQLLRGLDISQNAFIVNAEALLQIIASSAPWFALFFILSLVWMYIADRLFKRWNSSLHSEADEAHGKGIIYEIVKDNNSAAAIVLILPTLSIATVLVFIATLIK
jgi:hypothetical protein